MAANTAVLLVALVPTSVKSTAVLHTAFALSMVAGFTVLSGGLRLAAFGFGIVCFVAGVVFARRDGGSSPEA